MPGTRHFGRGTARAGRWLATALLLSGLAGCSGGGGASGPTGVPTVPQGGTAEGTSGGGGGGGGGQGGGETQDVRTREHGGGGGFADAGNVSASAAGSGDFAQVTLSTTSTRTFTATLSDVTDCTQGAKPATPRSATVTVTNGTSPPQQFTLATSTAGSRPLCLNVTIDGETRSFRADGTIQGTGAPTDGGTQVPTGGTGVPTGGTGAPSGSPS
ncbi:hypothetical protein ACGF07_14935 [Kitasatospora sp. NPDC048194]|uniref:hypothetical protein n=1 Tax=Kitasatospora sp. NPDC048194 TaxID=3364045 RepID=UPI0037165A27